MELAFNAFDTLPRDGWLTIDVNQLAENARLLQKSADRPLLIAVKANGYGHGYENAARAFLKGGASYLGVANLAEGLILKQIGISARILIMGGMLPHDMGLAAAAQLEFVVFREDHIAALREIPKGKNPIRVHIKIDSGMGRIGCFPHEAAAMGEALKAIPGIQIAGLGTHFAEASQPEGTHVKSQIAAFDAAIAALAQVGIRPEIIHAANSAGTLYHRNARYDMVRPGIVAYGVPPSSVPGLTIPPGIKTALTWHARVTSSKILPKDSKVSYGCEYTMPKDARVGVLPIGYADGYHRIPANANTVLIESEERRILGRVNMDQCMVDLEGLPDVTGTEAVLLGKQGDKEISVLDLAKRWETNTYGVYTGLSPRIPRRVKG